MSARTTVESGQRVPKLRVRKVGSAWSVERLMYGVWSSVSYFDTFEQAHFFAWKLIASRRPWRAAAHFGAVAGDHAATA